MAKATIKFSGRNGVIALGLVVCFAVFRFISLGPTNDPELKQKLLVELQSDVGNEVAKLLQKNSGSNDNTLLAEDITEMMKEGPKIHGIWVSKSLLEFSTVEKAVVKIEFSLPMNAKRNFRYYRAKDSAVTGWTIQQETTVVAYYLNFI